MGVLDKIKKGTLPTIIAISALSVSASAAFYSVSGLSKLFAGASFEVIIMAGSLEVAKLVIASLLYQYWSTINKLLRTYLTVATIILVLITSMGIYGFLSAAYQDTYRQLTVKNNQVAFLEQKTDFYGKDVARYDEELERISNNISTLSSAKASSIQVRDTTSSTGFRQTISTTELRLSQKRIDVEEENRTSIQAKREQVADSLQKYQLAILDLENNTDVAGELGPLEYLSGLTGTPMDKIINILLLVIIFVFDPLAISLVVAANFAFSQAFPKKKFRENLYGEQVEDDFSIWDTTIQDGLKNEEVTEQEVLEALEVKDAEEITSTKEFLDTLDKIEKTREDIIYEAMDDIEEDEEWVIKEEDDEWDDLDLNQDGVIDDEEIGIAKKRIEDLKDILQNKNLSGWRRNKIIAEIDRIKNLLSEDDLTITY